jgi:hypothetical protein
MNLDDLKSVWKESAQTDDNQWAVNSYLLKEVSLQKTHVLLREYKFTAIFETFAYAIFWICIVGFMADHWQEPRFLISSALLGMLALSGLGWGIYKWYQVQTINYELPLTEAQKRIARFQLFNRIEVKSLIIQVPVFFILFTIVAAKSWLGLDVFLIHPTLDLCNYRQSGSRTHHSLDLVEVPGSGIGEGKAVFGGDQGV